MPQEGIKPGFVPVFLPLLDVPVKSATQEHDFSARNTKEPSSVASLRKARHHLTSLKCVLNYNRWIIDGEIEEHFSKEKNDALYKLRHRQLCRVWRNIINLSWNKVSK